MPIVNEKLLKKYEKNNKSDYGRCCVRVALDVMRRLDDLKYRKINADKIICDADKFLNAGITGFMAGCVAQMVWKCHSRGEEFRMAWNKAHGVTEEKAKDRTVNPACMTINV